MNIFNILSYKSAISKILLEKKKLRPQMTFENMAKACGVQKAYLSRVLRHKGHLNSDQLYLAAKFLKLTNLETKYLLKLLQLETTVVEERKNLLQKQLDDIRQQSLSTEARTKVDVIPLNKEIFSEYYTDPNFSLIHMFLTIEEFAKDKYKICSHLNIERDKLDIYLDKLEEMKIIRLEVNKIQVLKDNLHLPESSYLIKAFRTLMRIKSLEKIDKVKEKEAYSFSVAFSSEPKVHDQIREKFLIFLEEVQTLVQKSNEKQVYQINFDLFKWS